MRPARATLISIIATICGIAFCACACSETHSAQPPPKEPRSMTTHEASEGPNPVLSAEEIGKRLLKLIGGGEIPGRDQPRQDSGSNGYRASA